MTGMCTGGPLRLGGGSSVRVLGTRGRGRGTGWGIWWGQAVLGKTVAMKNAISFIEGLIMNTLV